MRSASIFALILVMAACQPPPTDTDQGSQIDARTSEAAVPWTGLEANDAPQDFQFVVVTDRTGGHRPGVFAGAMAKVNLLEPAFVVSVGDLIEGYTDNQERLDREWDEMEGFINQLESPFFYTAGNHDMNNAVMAETWRTRFGPSYYHFLYKDVLFVVLNSELFGMVGQPDVPVPGPWTQGEQMQFIEHVLAEHAGVRWTIVLVHQPLWDTAEIDSDWLRVEALLGTRDYTVFAGHYHRYTKARRHDRNYITLATTGGGSALRGPVFGEFDHVAWVTMTAEGPTIANLLLDGIHDENVATLATRETVQRLSSAITTQGELADTAQFDNGNFTVLIHNPGDAPLTVAPQISRPGNFTIAGLERVIVAPGESAELKLELSAGTTSRYRELRAAMVDWTLTTQVAGNPLEINKLTAIMPLTRHQIPLAGVAPSIDGDLSEWPELRYRVDQQGDPASPATTPDDVSFRFDVQRDAANLYLAIDVTDDSIVRSPERIARDQDSIAVSIDTREDARRNASMAIGAALTGGTLAQITGAFLTLEESPATDELLGFMVDVAKQLTVAVVPTANGYRAELAVPSRLLDAQAGGEWQDARIDIRVYDFDAGEEGNVVLHWQPYRFGNSPLAGTHAFRR